MKELLLFFSVAFAWGWAPAIAKESWNNPPRKADAGVRHETFRSASLKTEVGYNVCLPPQYAQHQDARFPVIYYLHGYQGNESSYLEYARYWQESVSRFGPSILVFVNGGDTSFFCDSPDGAVPAETLLVRELIPHIDQKFRTVPRASARSLHGYSMGGFGALKLVTKYPEIFGSAIAYGPTLSDGANFKKHLGKVYERMFGGDPSRFAQNDPLVLAEQNAEKLRGHISVRLVVGTKDEFLAQNRALRDKLLQLKIPVAYEEVRGAAHKKEDIYETAAVSGFQFSAERFKSGQAQSLDKP